MALAGAIARSARRRWNHYAEETIDAIQSTVLAHIEAVLLAVMLLLHPVPAPRPQAARVQRLLACFVLQHKVPEDVSPPSLLLGRSQLLTSFCPSRDWEAGHRLLCQPLTT